MNFFNSNFGCEDFLRIIDWMPYIIELDFECSCKAICVREEVAKADSECLLYNFKLVGKQEHCYVEKEFKGKQCTDKK